jgi:phosphate transport system substrate-binding protein
VEPGVVVRLAGSDTMLPLARRLAERFMSAHPRVAVRVEGGGSGAGIAALVDGRVDLCTASRPLTPDEVQALAERRGTLGVTFLIAEDALSVYLNRSNPVRDLSLDQLRAVFAGEARDWSEVGGDQGTIVVLIRPPASGTHRFFRDHVLHGGDYRTDARVLATTTEIVAAVAADPNAVGYGGVAYGPDLVHCAVDGVPPPGPATAGSRVYPLTRFLTLVAAAPPQGWARRFVDWCQGAEGQRVVAEVGYLPLWPPTSRGAP